MRLFLGQFKPFALFSKILVIFVVLFLIASQVFAQTEIQKVDLSLTPAPQTTTINQKFTLDVEIDGKPNKVSGADIEINFDPEFVSVESIIQDKYLPTVLMPSAIDNINGRATITLGSSINNPPTGKGKLLSLEFKALKNTQVPSKIIINPESAVTAIGQSQNMLGQINNTNLLISETDLTKTAMFELYSPNESTKIGEVFTLTLRAISAIDEANLFASELSFDQDVLEVVKIDTSNSFITNWASDTFNNSTGKIKLIGGVPTPGFKTSELGADFAQISFKSKNREQP